MQSKIHLGKKLERGQMWYAKLYIDNPEEKARPCVIVQSEEGLQSEKILIAPVSKQWRYNYPFIQRIRGKKALSQIHYECVRQVHRDSLDRFILKLTPEQIIEMDLRLPISLGLENSSILNLQSIKVEMRYIEDSLTWYKVYVKKRFGESIVKFNEEDFYNFFRKGELNLKNSTLEEITEFLDSLSGLKFMYMQLSKFKGKVYEQS